MHCAYAGHRIVVGQAVYSGSMNTCMVFMQSRLHAAERSCFQFKHPSLCVSRSRDHRTVWGCPCWLWYPLHPFAVVSKENQKDTYDWVCVRMGDKMVVFLLVSPQSNLTRLGSIQTRAHSLSNKNARVWGFMASGLHRSTAKSQSGSTPTRNASCEEWSAKVTVALSASCTRKTATETSGDAFHSFVFRRSPCFVVGAF